MSPLWDQDKYLEAYLFAAEAHRGQTIPNGTDLPYIIHPSLVSMEVMAAISADSTIDGTLLVQCALLHDVVEDTGASIEEIRTRFGDRVAGGVAALTKNEGVEKPKRMADSLRRIREQPQEVWMVKLADRITNLQPPPPTWSKEEIEDYRQEAVEILDALGSASSLLATRVSAKIRTYASNPR